MGDLSYSSRAISRAAWWEDLGRQIFSLPAPGSLAAGLWPKCAAWMLLPGILTWLEWPTVQSESGVTQRSMETVSGGASVVCEQNAPVILVGLAWLLWFASLDPQPSQEAFFQ